MIDPIEFVSQVQAKSFRFLPTRLISRSWGHFTRTKASRHLISPFASMFRIAKNEAELPLGEYPTLNAFFTRRLKPGCRPIDQAADSLVSPVDGRVSAFGACDQDRLYQIKGIEYSLFELLRDGPMARRFEHGAFATLYLSPQDYHRVHAPLDMEIVGLGYMPGTLLPVNEPSVKYIDKLYTQNERLMIYAKAGNASLAVVFVGAHCVGSISLAFHDFVTNQPGVGPQRLDFARPRKIKKGQELGIFEMGSTILLLFEQGSIALQPPKQGMPVRLGQRIGKILPSGSTSKESEYA